MYWREEGEINLKQVEIYEIIPMPREIQQVV